MRLNDQPVKLGYAFAFHAFCFRGKSLKQIKGFLAKPKMDRNEYYGGMGAALQFDDGILLFINRYQAKE